MSALPQTKHASDDQVIGLANGFSKIFVNNQEIVKIFNQKTGMVMQGMCKFDESIDFLYPLFKGLSQLGKPLGLNLRFSASEKAAYFYYPTSHHKEVSSFFFQLILHLQNEVKFKKVLKEIIRNRKQFLSEQSLLHNAMMGTVET